MGDTGPESTAPAAAPGAGGAGIRPAGAGAGEDRETLTFEAAQKELDEIVERLERGQAGLDEVVALLERGQELYRFCKEKLDTAHGRIEELARRGGATG